MRIPIMGSIILLSTVALSAQQGWEPVKGPDAARHLLYRITSTPKGPVIEFRNDGGERIHFSFWFKQHQTREKAAFNGRVHQSPGAQPSRLPLPVIQGVDAATLVRAQLHVFRVTTGLADAGNPAPEEP